MTFRIRDRRLARSLAVLAVATTTVAATYGAAADDDVNYQLSWIPTGDAAPLFAGIAKGFYKEEGINLTVTTGRGSGDAVKRVAGGGSPIGDGDISAVIVGRVNEKAPVRCLMHTHQHAPHSLFVLGSSGITNFKELAGKTLATTPGNSHRNYFPLAARLAGLDPDSVTWTVVDAATMPGLLVNKKVDAVPYFTTNAAFVRPPIEARGDTLKIIPFLSTGFDIYAYCIYAREDVIKSNPDMIRRFVKATQKSYLWARDNTEEAVQIHTKQWPQTKFADNMASWIDMRDNMFGPKMDQPWTGKFNGKKLQATYNALVESQGLDPKYDVTQAVDDSFIPE